MTDTSLPSRGRVARRLIRKAITVDPWRSAVTVLLAALVAASGSLFALWFRQIVNAVGSGDHGAARAGAIALAGTIFVWSLCDYAGSLVGAVLSEKAGRVADEELLTAITGAPGLEIHETPEHLLQLERLEWEGWEFSQATASLVGLLFNLVWILTTFVVLGTISPWLLLLPLAGLPSVALSGKTNGLYRTGNDAAAEPTRKAGAWWSLVTTSASNRELRVFGSEAAAMERFAAAQASRRMVQRPLQIEARLIGLATRSIFAAGYIAAVVFVANRAANGAATTGDVILTAALAGQVLNLVNGTAETVQWSLRTLTAAGRFVYLLQVAHQSRPAGTKMPPPALTNGIRVRGVTYNYPGGTTAALRSADLFLPAGATVAIVGDNGAGKSTLVKLLCSLYTPTSGTIEIDGTNLADIDIAAWRMRIAACFQDFARVELSVRESIGIGDLAAGVDAKRVVLPSDDAVQEAIDAAGAEAALERAGELGGVLGLRYDAGAELSVGQWQRVALARAAMRTAPLLLLLDEPTAALDPDAERDLWERYTAQSRNAAQNGGITVIVSHRLSTVRTADLIVVIDRGRVVETGTHDELVRAQGRYATLFAMQAEAYS